MSVDPSGGSSGLDADRVEDGVPLGDVIGGSIRGVEAHEHDPGSLDVEDPELLGLAGRLVGVERTIGRARWSRARRPQLRSLIGEIQLCISPLSQSVNWAMFFDALAAPPPVTGKAGTVSSRCLP